MAGNFLCDLTNKVNQLTEIINNMQHNTGLYTDTSTETTLTGRIKKLEEVVITPVPSESNISRLKVDVGLVIDNGTITTTYAPIGDCVNREVMVNDPNDSEVWEVISNVVFSDKTGILGTQDYNGWLATVSYLYAEKITFEEYTYDSVVEELVKNLYDYIGNAYKVIFSVTPTNQVTLKWVNNLDTNDYVEEVITTEHIRHVSEEEFNNSLYITGSATVKIEVKYRLA